VDAQSDSSRAFALLVYLVAFVTGALVMSFEMLGSRYLNPYFGSGIYTWAALIATVLAALCAGYFLGGWLADRRPSAAVLGTTVVIGSVYLLLLPLFSDRLLDALLASIEDIRTGSLISALAIMFFPVTFLGMYSPFAIRLLLRATQRSGTTSGMVYGISTAGAIVGTLGTTFVLIPAIGSRAITLSLGAAGVAAGLLLIAGARLDRRSLRLWFAALVFAVPLAVATLADGAEELVDNESRAATLKRPDGVLARIETEYNDIFITKNGHELSMSFQLKGWDYTQSTTNLRDPDDLSLLYAQRMVTAVAYVENPRKILMLGMGGGSISTYLGRFLPEATIDTVEIDPGVIDAGRHFFGLRASERVRYLPGDGRVYLKRNKSLYDLILVDAFHGGYIPFHLLTREFCELVKERLAPGGAAVFNIHDGTKLYVSAVLTLRAVFPTVHLYPSGEGEVAVVATPRPEPPREALAEHAGQLQTRYGFRFPLPRLLDQRMETLDVSRGVMLTDDFAPVNLYDAIRERKRRKK
jgi:spermidine synthase